MIAQQGAGVVISAIQVQGGQASAFHELITHEKKMSMVCMKRAFPLDKKHEISGIQITFVHNEDIDQSSKNKVL